MKRLKMNLNFKEFSAKSIGNFIKTDVSESYVVYKFTISIGKNLVKILEKRFSDFSRIRDTL